VNEHATTLCVLVKGSVRITFPGEECILSHEGDYVIWPAGMPHRWVVTEDSLVLTMRWPSTPGDYQDIS
jgi:quercetin dioxygenase-like cupin family protein